MRRISIMMAILALILVACGSAEEEPLPTVMELPTLPPEATADATPEDASPPTEEAAPPTEEVAPTQAPAATQEAAPPPTQALPQMPPRTPENEAENDQAAMPDFGSVGSPLDTAQPQQNDNFVVQSNQPVNVFQCTQPECPILATLTNGSALNVIEEDENWVTVELEDGSTGYVEARFVVVAAFPAGPGDLPPGVVPPGEGGATSEAPVGPPNDGGVPFPPGEDPENPGFPPGVVPGTPAAPPPGFPPGTGNTS